MLAEGIEILPQISTHEFWLLGDDGDAVAENVEVHIRSIAAIVEDLARRGYHAKEG